MVSEITINFNLEKIFKDYIFYELIDLPAPDFKDAVTEVYYMGSDSFNEIKQYRKFLDNEEHLKNYENLEKYFKIIIRGIMNEHKDIYQIRCIYEKEGENFNIFNPINLDDFSSCPPDYNLAEMPKIIRMISTVVNDLFLNFKEEIQSLIERDYDIKSSVEYDYFTVSIRKLRKYKHLCFILKDLGFNEMFYHDNSFYILDELHYQFNFYKDCLRYPPEQIKEIFYFFEKRYGYFDLKNIKKFDFGFYNINFKVKLVIYKDKIILK